MRLPDLAQPVMRGIARTTGVAAAPGIRPSGDCPAGYWCCRGGQRFPGQNFCLRCSETLFGHCISFQSLDCHNYFGAEPSGGC
jgi:hypothetical protein